MVRQGRGDRGGGAGDPRGDRGNRVAGGGVRRGRGEGRAGQLFRDEQHGQARRDRLLLQVPERGGEAHKKGARRERLQVGAHEQELDAVLVVDSDKDGDVPRAAALPEDQPLPQLLPPHAQGPHEQVHLQDADPPRPLPL